MITLDELRGKINDVDSHELVPVPLWEEKFGATGAMFADFIKTTSMPSLDPEAAKQRLKEGGSNNPNLPIYADDAEITIENITRLRGALAPGAIEPERRVQVLDLQGVDRQMVFAGFALFGQLLGHCTPQLIKEQLGVNLTEAEARSLCVEVNRAHNDWAIGYAKTDRRLRPVGNISTFDFDDMMAEAERTIDAGLRVLWIPSSLPPCGVSPANRLMDPFWALCESANVAVVFHIISEAFLASQVWRNIPELQPKPGSFEFPLDPWTLTTTPWAPESFLTTLILGGVLERFPNLHLGVIECGAHWVGPFADQLAMWGKVFPRRYEVLTRPVHEYFSQNIRVSPFYFEEVDKYIERFGLEDVYCYASDYPHVEGGSTPMQGFAERIAPLGDTVMEKFFYKNGELLLPA
jgi:predicted TIM-barrel fold metal-dependent hydrolase